MRGHDLVGEERRGAGFASGEPGDRAAGDIVRAVAREGGEPEDVGLAECDGFGDEALYVRLDAVRAAVLGEGGVRRLAQGLPAAGADGGARQGSEGNTAVRGGRRGKAGGRGDAQGEGNVGYHLRLVRRGAGDDDVGAPDAVAHPRPPRARRK